MRRFTSLSTPTALACGLFSILLVPGCVAPEPEDSGPAAGSDPKGALQVSATRVEAATVDPSSLSVRIVRPGEVEAEREAHLASATGGFIEVLKVSDGDVVAEGDLLAKVDTSLMSAQRSLAAVEVNDAKRELARLQKMGGAVSKSRVQEEKTRLERAKAQLRVSSIQAQRTLIKAPFAGVIASVDVERGEVAPPGGSIARLVSVDPISVSVSVTDRDIGSIEVGGSAAVTTGAVAEPRTGTVKHIDPTADPKTRSFLVEVELENSDGVLRPGMIASVDFRRSVSQTKLTIPQDFLVTRLDGNGVFVVDDESIARWRPLVLGEVIRDQVIVESGLTAGENVVILGQRSLSDGDQLVVSRQGVCCNEGRVEFEAPEVAELSRGKKATPK